MEIMAFGRRPQSNCNYGAAVEAIFYRFGAAGLLCAGRALAGGRLSIASICSRRRGIGRSGGARRGRG